ncbi:MAG TPA: hypothetical protein VI358_12195 [Pseudolabrys sp.]
MSIEGLGQWQHALDHMFVVTMGVLWRRFANDGDLGVGQLPRAGNRRADH